MTEFASWRPAAALLGLVAAASCGPASSAPPGPVSPPASPASASAEAASSRGAAPPAAARAVPASPAGEVLEKGRAPLDACYAEARAARPSLGRTTVEITFLLADDGSPMAIDLLYKDRLDDHAKECMRAAAFTLRFPPALRGKQTGTILFP